MPDRQLAMQRALRGDGSSAGRPTMLAIAGDSATGKTTLTRGLVEALGPDEARAICVDDYHRYDRTERKSLPFTPLHPDCNYLDVMDQHLQLLALGHPILKPVYDHSSGELVRPVLIEPRRFMVVEGLLPLHSKLSRACFDVKVFLDPPEPIRRGWKVHRDTTTRGYTAEQVLADIERREADSAAYIRPQRAEADIVVTFSPIEERGESADDPLSATLLLRPTIRHPSLQDVITEDVGKALHLKLMRDDDGRPIDALHIHAYAPAEQTRQVERTIWQQLGGEGEPPEALGRINGDSRSGALAVTQLILLYHLLQVTGGD